MYYPEKELELLEAVEHFSVNEETKTAMIEGKLGHAAVYSTVEELMGGLGLADE